MKRKHGAKKQIYIRTWKQPQPEKKRKESRSNVKTYVKRKYWLLI